jgi:hypothetical protein
MDRIANACRLLCRKVTHKACGKMTPERQQYHTTQHANDCVFARATFVRLPASAAVTKCGSKPAVVDAHAIVGNV